MFKISDVNCSAHSGASAPELIHGLWYRYCAGCGAYHALVSGTEPADKPAAPAFKAITGGRAAGKGRGNVIPLRPNARLPRPNGVARLQIVAGFNPHSDPGNSAA